MPENIIVDAVRDRHEDDAMFGYYVVSQPTWLGQMLPGSMAVVSYEGAYYRKDIGAHVWGWTAFPEPLAVSEMQHYGLVPDEVNTCVWYPCYRIEQVSYEKYPDGRKLVTHGWYEDEDGEAFITPYRPGAEWKTRKLNDDAWSTNTPEKFVRYVLRERPGRPGPC